jgi:hypothetical protein
MEKKSPNTLHKSIGIFSLALSLSLELYNVVQKRQSEESELQQTEQRKEYPETRNHMRV